MKRNESDPKSPRWAYAYEIQPAQPSHRLAPIRALLERETAHARRQSHTWEARLMREARVSHILIVADTPDQGREVNRLIEAELGALQAHFVVTLPMMVPRDDDEAAAHESTAASPLPPRQ
jgi:hypothetical protein